MARNYVDFYSGRVNVGGNYVSFVNFEKQESIDAVNSYINTFGGTLDWSGKIGYFLYNDQNLVNLLRNWVTHYPAAFGSTWIWFQDGLKATKSPRDTWSGGQ